MANDGQDDFSVTIEGILCDPCSSRWIKAALESALLRDPVDAANDAEVLAQALKRRCEQLLLRNRDSE
jgi:hypothetical protein